MISIFTSSESTVIGYVTRPQREEGMSPVVLLRVLPAPFYVTVHFYGASLVNPRRMLPQTFEVLLPNFGPVFTFSETTM